MIDSVFCLHGLPAAEDCSDCTKDVATLRAASQVKYLREFYRSVANDLEDYALEIEEEGGGLRPE